MKILIFTRTLMSRFRQNDRERAVGIVQAGMSHQAVADHYNVSKITISRLMIRLRQTGRTNDIPHNGRPRVTSQRQDRHLRIIHLRDRMITAEETARRTPVLTNVRISGQTVRRRLRESGLRVRRLVVELILMQPQRTARLAWARACRRLGLHTWQHILFSDESRIPLRLTMDVIVCTTSVGNVLRTSVFTSSTVLEADVLWRGMELVMMVALSSKLLQEHWVSWKTETIFLILSFCPFCNSETLITSFNMTMARVCQDFLNQNHIRALPWPALYHRICHQLNIYRMNSVDVFAIVKIHQNHYRGCVTHLIDWFYASEMRSCRCCKRWSHTLLNFRKPPHCMTISVCPWFVLIMMLRHFVDIALFVLPIWI